MGDVTRLLEAIGRGDEGARDDLLPLVYDELRGLARFHMANERADHTLQATALLHETYLRLFGEEAPKWESRGEFFAAAAEAMRRILVESARRRQRLKRGGDHVRVDLDEACLAANFPPDELMALNEAVDSLATHDEAAAELVKLRYFVGLSLEEAAAVLQLSRTTAYRHWTYARAWLISQIRRP